MNKNAPPDDGCRHMPKLKCPYGNHRFADVPDVAFRNVLELRKLWDHQSGTPRFYQYVQSFSPTENVTPETVHEIGCEFAKQFGNREIFVATHIDRVIARSEEQVGRASARVSDFIWRRAQREDALWWLKLILFALPLILFLLSWVRWGFLDLSMS